MGDGGLAGYGRGAQRHSPIDLLASHGCATLIGYNHPAVVEAIKEQVGRLYSVSAEFPTAPIVQLAEKLIAVTPEALKSVFFASAGTEVVEAGLFLAKKHTRRHGIVSLYGDFHGRSHGSRSLLGADRRRPGQRRHDRR